MLSALYRRLLIPAYEQGLKRRQTFRYRRALEASQWWSYEQLREQQFVALRQLIEHAYAHCQYYHQQWSKLGLLPSKLRSFEDWQAWPVVDRHTVRRHRLALRSDDGRRLLSKSTGGSSGDPLQFDLDLASDDHRNAAWLRGYGWAGAELGSKQFYLWGAPLDAQTPRARVKQWLYHRCLYRRRMFNSFNLQQQSFRAVVSAINRFAPQSIVAYTNPLYELARAILRERLPVHCPQSIVVGAEKLHDFQRQLIQQAFHAPVYDNYGSR